MKGCLTAAVLSSFQPPSPPRDDIKLVGMQAGTDITNVTRQLSWGLTDGDPLISASTPSAGDFIVTVVTTPNSSSGGSRETTISGHTRLVNAANQASTIYSYFSMHWKIAGVDETAPLFSTTNGNNGIFSQNNADQSWIVAVFRGVDQTSPIVNFASGGGYSNVTSGITTKWDDFFDVVGGISYGGREHPNNSVRGGLLAQFVLGSASSSQGVQNATPNTTLHHWTATGGPASNLYHTKIALGIQRANELGPIPKHSWNFMQAGGSTPTNTRGWSCPGLILRPAPRV